MKRNIFIVLSIVALSACSSTSSAPTPKSTKVTLPSLNEIHEVYLGDYIINQAIGVYTPSVTVDNADGAASSVSAGKFFFDGKYFVSYDQKSIGIKNMFGSIVSYSNVANYDSEKNVFCPVQLTGYEQPCYNSDELEMNYNPSDFRVSPASFKQQIEYNGKQGDIINLTYREFSNDRARAAYTTDFKIDLSEGDTFGYKGAQFKVIKGTNNKFRYKIIKGFRTSDNGFN